MASISDIAKRTIDTAAQDGYCPIWEVVDEVALKCDIPREEAVSLIRQLGEELLTSDAYSFWTSVDPYGVPALADPSSFFGDGLERHNRISDGSPFYYLHKSPRGH